MDSRLLGIVADTALSEAVRMGALADLVDLLPKGHPYRAERLETLYERLKQPWETRMYLQNGRGVERKVSRPPLCLADVL